MARKTYTPEQIINKLREAEILLIILKDPSFVLLALARADTTQLSFNLKTFSPDILLSKSL